MKKSNIKVHLIDEQTGRNSGIVHPQAGNDSVRRMMGSGDSGSGGSGSGDGGSGDGGSGGFTPHGENIQTSFSSSYAEDGISWDVNGTLQVFATVSGNNDNYRIFVQTAIFSYHIRGGQQVVLPEGEKEVTYQGNKLSATIHLNVGGGTSYSENALMYEGRTPVKLVISRIVKETVEGIERTTTTEQNYDRTLQLKFTILVNKKNNSLSFEDRPSVLIV